MLKNINMKLFIMKYTISALILVITFSACIPNRPSPENIAALTLEPDTTDATNNFYDNTEVITLPIPEITIGGEINTPGKADLSLLPVHSLFVKEALLDSTGSDRFVGAYSYTGYSLFDILDHTVLQKANAKEFNPIIDLYVEIENAKGEKVVFSWGEIYYPNSINRIIVATSVSRIVPSKSKDLWPVPNESKIVAGNDLITERNISAPIKITVKSYPRSFPVNRDISPLYSKDFKLFRSGRLQATLAPVSEKENVTYNTIFYGRGRGIHSTIPFYGMLLKDHLYSYYPVSRENLRAGVFCFAALDGYRCAVSYSELFNRNDQQEFLLVRTEPNEDGGYFRIFPAADFFSDRAIKSISEIHFDPL
jgi:hypothetical protein